MVTSGFGKVSVYKLNIQKPILFLYVLINIILKHEIKIKILFIIVSNTLNT